MVGTPEDAARFVEDLMKTRDIEYDYVARGLAFAAASPVQMLRVRTVAKILHQAGGTGTAGTSDELGLPRGFVGGMRDAVGGALNPEKLCRGARLAEAPVEAADPGLRDHAPPLASGVDGPCVPIGVRGRPVRISRPPGVPLGVLGLHLREPEVDLADSEPELTADSETAGTAAVATQVAQSLHRDPELRRELRQRDDEIEPVV